MCPTADRIHAARMGIEFRGICAETASSAAGVLRILERMDERPDLIPALIDPLETALASCEYTIADLQEMLRHA